MTPINGVKSVTRSVMEYSIFLAGVVCGFLLSFLLRAFKGPVVECKKNRGRAYDEEARLAAAMADMMPAESVVASADRSVSSVEAPSTVKSESRKVGAQKKQPPSILATVVEEAQVSPASAEEARLLAHLLKD
jgi:hypothetical protein